MARWIIYSKNGQEKAMTGGVTVGHRTMPQLEYSGTWMGESFVTVTVKSPAPVDWQIGDYLLYRGEKFVLNYDPTVVKKAKAGASGEGFVYESVKFNALHVEMVDTKFLDEVLSDNHVHYTSLPTFSFFAESIDDYADRLQANMNRYCLQNSFALADWWLILTPSRARTVARGVGVSGLAARLGDAWDLAYQGDPSTENEKFNKNVSISNSSVWGGLANIYNLFGLHYVTSGRTLVIGAAGKIADHIFEYGRGKGLYEIERVADSEQQIVTKLFAYGNSTNLPIRYYAQINKTCFATITSIETLGSSFKLDIVFKEDMFNGEQNPAVALVSRKVKFVDSHNVEHTCYCSSDKTYPVAQHDGHCYLNTFSGELNPALSVGEVITFTEGINTDKWPSGHYTYVNDDSVLPDNLAINNLMLPGFPTESLYDWVVKPVAQGGGGGTVVDAAKGKATWRGHTAIFSKQPLVPYIMSVNADLLGIREASKTWDGSDDTDDIYPTIENTDKGVLVSADVITDNGIFGDEDPPTFNVIVKGLGANVELDSLVADNDAKISMKDGYCGGREFDVLGAKKVSGSTNWKLTLNRCPDESLQLYFPYSNNAAMGHTPTANEAYQLRGSDIAGYDGDKFVWLGIDMPAEYINASAVKLLEAALEFLESNDYTRYTFSPKVDEIYMAHQHDKAVASQSTANPIASLHDTLKEGDLMHFRDEGNGSLNVDGIIFIDQLRIKEFGNKSIPTYEITLRNQKTVGTIERLVNTVDSISSGKSGGAGGGGVSPSQTKALIHQEGDKRYIRRDINDETDTSITANEFIAKQGIKTDEITPKTPNEPISMNGDVDISGDSNVEGTLESKGATSLAKQGGKTTMGGNAEIKGNADVAGDVTTNENYQEMTDNTDGIGARMTSDGRIFAWGMQQGDPENPFLGSHFRTVVFGRYVPGLITGTQSGAAIFDSGHAKFKSVAIGEFLEVPELRFNRATVSIGIGLRSKGGGIIEKVEIDQDGNGGWCRLKLEDGEYGAIEYNDFLLGFYHHEVLDANGDVDVNATIQSNSQANYDNHDGDYELCGFQSVYFRIDQIDAHQFDDEDEPVAATRNDRFHYVLRGNGGTSGRSYRNHPHESMHFALIANPSNTARQSLVVTTTEYEVRLMNLTNWNYTSNNIRSIDGKLDGFSMTSRYWDDATQQYVEYTKVFTGNGTVLGNAYIYGQLDQFERVGYRCYVEQSLNGSILPQDTETETVRVFNGYGEDVTHEFTRFSVTRDSGDAVSDAVWNAAHSNVSNPFQIAFSDLGIDGIYRTSVLFQVTATNVVSGTTTQGTTLEFSI